MVGQTVLHVPFDAMIVVHALDACVGRGAVMNDDVFPFARLHPDFIQPFRPERTRSGVAPGGLRIGNDQLLADAQFVGSDEAVALSQFADGQPVPVRQVRQRVVALDGVGLVCRRDGNRHG